MYIFLKGFSNSPTLLSKLITLVYIVKNSMDIEGSCATYEVQSKKVNGN